MKLHMNSVENFSSDGYGFGKLTLQSDSGNTGQVEEIEWDERESHATPYESPFEFMELVFNKLGISTTLNEAFIDDDTDRKD